MNNKNDDTRDDLKIKAVLDIESQNKNILTEEKLSKEKIKVKKPITAKSIKHLLLGVKNISIFRLYYTISTPFDLILISIAILISLCSGCSGILLAMVFGDSTDSLIVGRFLEIFQKKISKETLQPIIDLIFDYLDPDIDEKVKLYLIIGAIMFGCNFIMMFLWSYTATKQIHWMKADYFRLILNQEQGWFDKNNSYEFATKVQAQLKQIEIGIGDRCGQLIVMIAEILAGLIFAFISSWKLALFFLTCLPFIASGGLLMSFCLNGVNLKSRKAYEVAGGIAEELLYNIKTVTTFVNFEYELQRYGHLIDEVEKIGKRKAIISGLSIGIIIFGIFIGYTCCLLYARKIICDHYDKYDSEANHIINDIADIIVNKDNTDTFYSSDTSNNKEIRDLLQPLKMIYTNINNHEITIGTVLKVISSLIGAIIAIGQIFPILQLIKEACVSSSDYFVLRERIPNFDTSGKNLTPERENIKGRIEFKDIKFIYPSDKTQRPILNGLNLSIEPGKKIAFVGESGCGKSTTVNLLERLYEPTEGHILLDGIDIKDFNLEYLRTLIGYVQQEPVLFNKSIKENLYFGRYDAVKNLGDPNKLMEEAARDADITEFIHKFPERFDYVVGVKGNKLSGGQKQRIAIARAILAKPKILILDEATSALDNKSEKEVQRSLDNISKRNVTTLIIAHRLSTIQNADVIYALKGGKVEEMGTHEELLQKKGYYYHLVESQCGEDHNKARVHKQIEAKKTTIGKLTKDYTKIITALQKYEKGEIGKSPEIKYKEIFNLISDHKCDLFLGTLAGFIYGVGTPLYGFLLAKAIN